MDELEKRLALLQRMGVSRARFDEEGRLMSVEFGVALGAPPETEPEQSKPNPIREAALRMTRPQASNE